MKKLLLIIFVAILSSCNSSSSSSNQPPSEILQLSSSATELNSLSSFTSLDALQADSSNTLGEDTQMITDGSETLYLKTTDGETSTTLSYFGTIAYTSDSESVEATFGESAEAPFTFTMTTNEDSSITINFNGLMTTEIESVTYSIRFTNFQLTISNTAYSMTGSMVASSGTDSYRIDFNGTSATYTIFEDGSQVSSGSFQPDTSM